MRSGSLTEKLLRHASPRTAETLHALPDLEAILQKALDQARAAWPKISLDDDTYLRHVAGRLPDGEDAVRAIGTLHNEDLYLACACAHRDLTAVTLFEKRFLPEVTDALARMDRSAAMVQEVAQQLRQRLLVGDGVTAPKIGDYAGRGPLASWIRAAAVRTALTMFRQNKREANADEQLMNSPGPTEDPELDYIRAHYRDEFKEAFQQALASLSTRERNVLRLNLLDGLNIEQIGVVYRTHRSTVARWIARARENLLDHMRSSLTERLKLSPSEFKSLMGLVRSQLDVSLHGFLRKSPPE